jgi:hypothetical protein
MNAIDLQQIWQEQNEELNQSVSVNREQVLKITRMKVSSALAKAKPIKWFAIGFGILWVLFIYSLIIHFLSMEYIFFVVSAGVHSVLTNIAIGIYIYHLVMINKIDNSKSVAEVQERLANLQSTTLVVNRLMFIQLPVFATFYLTPTWLEQMSTGRLFFVIGQIALFTAAGLWFFFNIKKENMHKKWFRFLFSSQEWTSIEKANDIVDQLGEKDA